MKLQINEKAKRAVLDNPELQAKICKATKSGLSTVQRWLYKPNVDRLSQKVVFDLILKETGLQIVFYAAAQH